MAPLDGLSACVCSLRNEITWNGYPLKEGATGLCYHVIVQIKRGQMELKECQLHASNTQTTRRYPPTVMHIFCDGRDKIFCIIRALRFMTIFLSTAMKSAHVFPGNLPEFVFYCSGCCFRCQLWFTLSDLLNKTRFHDLINFKKWYMSTWQLNHVRWLGKVTGSHNMYDFMWTFVFLQNFSFPFSSC